VLSSDAEKSRLCYKKILPMSQELIKKSRFFAIVGPILADNVIMAISFPLFPRSVFCLVGKGFAVASEQELVEKTQTQCTTAYAIALIILGYLTI
jgi:hypothetical protein